MAPAKKKQKISEKLAKPIKSGKSPLKSKEMIEEVENKNIKKVLHEKNSTIPKRYWLLKSEPESRIQKGVDVKFGIEDLKKEDEQTTYWDGVRNYQARNLLRDELSEGDEAFFYHSNCKPPGIVGLVTVVKPGYPDHTQFDAASNHYDPKSNKTDPKWFMVDVKYKRMMERYIPLSELKTLHNKHKESNGPLKNIGLLTKPRLSVQPITEEEFNFILTLEKL